MNCNSSTIFRSVWKLVVFLLAASPVVGRSANSTCIAAAAAHFDVPQPLLDAILLQESGGHCPARHARNRNGSYDIGCAGINSSWLPLLASRFGIQEAELYNPCVNVHVGAWILAQNLRRYGNTWRAVGAYNAITESKRKAYSWKIFGHLRRGAGR